MNRPAASSAGGSLGDSVSTETALASDRADLTGGGTVEFRSTRGPLAAFAREIRPNRKTAIDLASLLAGAVLSFCLLGWMAAIFASLWWVAVMVVIRSDLEHFIIPDAASAAIAALGLGFALASSIGFGRPLEDAADAVGTAVLGGSLASAVFWLVARLYRHRSGRDGLGLGDVKLAGALAIWLDPRGQLTALEIAALAAISCVLLFRRGTEARAVAIPFGAFMAPSAWLVFVIGPVLSALMEKLP